MIKRILLLIIILTSSCAQANFFEELGNCFADPCNCGNVDGRVDEVWGQANQQARPNQKPNNLCPPYNKNSGREDHTCLVRPKDQFTGETIPYPTFGYYSNLCAEEAPESTYFEPKIRVRGQQCNVFGCWTENHLLRFDGGCVTMAGGYLFPLHRMCARIAMPGTEGRGKEGDANYVAPQSPDPGYTAGKHLSYEGELLDDEKITLTDGTEILVAMPKLCAYNDPSFLDFDEGIDFMDVNPNYQPSHKTDQTHPVMQVIISIINTGADLANILPTILGSLSEKGAEESNGFGKVILEVLAGIFKFLSFIIEILGDAVAGFLTEIGRINNVVKDKKYGCVNIPQGPMPPPYAGTINPVFPTISMQRICPVAEIDTKDENGDIINEAGLPIKSYENDPCVNPNYLVDLRARNNYIHNSVRVGFDDYIPLCGNNTNTANIDPTQDDSCVSIDNVPAATPSIIHATNNGSDILPKCAPGVEGSCVSTVIDCVDCQNDNKGFRVIYAIKTGDIIVPSPYYTHDYPDCGSADNTGIACQMVWGINALPFKDIVLEHKAGDSSTYSETGIEETVTVNFTNKDGIATPYIINAAITGASQLSPATSQQQEPHQICAVAATNDYGFINCVERAPVPEISVYECGSEHSTCSSTHFHPNMTLGMHASYITLRQIPGGGVEEIWNTDSLYTTLPLFSEPGGAGNFQSRKYEDTIFLGSSFNAFVTDETLVSEPFPRREGDEHNLTPTTYLADYVNVNNGDPIYPLDKSGDDFTLKPNATYYGGLQYVARAYQFGGKYMCANPVDSKKCTPENNENCVLSRLLNTDVVDCQVFQKKAREKNGLDICGSTSDSCIINDSISDSDGNSIDIKKCTPSTGQPYFCYDHDEEICVVSLKSEDRVIPSPALGDQLEPNQRYELTYQTNYNKNLFVARTKTPLEMGLCIAIPKARCNSVTEDNMTWSAANLGETSSGSCIGNFIMEGDPDYERYCGPNSNLNGAVLSRIPRDTADPSKKIIRCVAPPPAGP